MQAADSSAGELHDLPTLVTGAAGSIGSAVCRRLTAAGVRVTAMIRDDGQTPPRTEDGNDAYDRLVVGDTADEAAVGEALTGVGRVVHLAAFISPNAADPRTVFVNNVASTFTVLHGAGEAGVRRAAIASSINASGLPFNPDPDVDVAYYPVDEDLPPDIEDPYSLSKQTDEQTAKMITRRFGMATVAFRFPLTTSHDRLVEFSALDPGQPASIREGWSYLDVRDAARAVELALTEPITGAHRMLVAADTVRVPHRTEDLLDRYVPGVPRRRRFDRMEVPLDLTRARTTLGFRAEHQLELTPRPLPKRR